MTWRATPLSDSSDGLYVEVAKSYAKRNCLLIGPTGSGKLSLARGLAALANPRARKFLFDWEVEPGAQDKLLHDLTRRSEVELSRPEVWIHRQIERLSTQRTKSFLDALRVKIPPKAHMLIVYATAAPGDWLSSNLERLSDIFGIRVTLSDGGFASGSLDSVVRCAMSSLQQKYGGETAVLDPEAIRILESLASGFGINAALHSLERAYLRAGCRQVTAESLNPRRYQVPFGKEEEL